MKHIAQLEKRHFQSALEMSVRFTQRPPEIARALDREPRNRVCAFARRASESMAKTSVSSFFSSFSSSGNGQRVSE